MKRNVRMACWAVCGIAVMAGGCTKKEMVKSDQQLAPSATSAATAKAPVKTEPVKESPVKTEPAVSPAQTAQNLAEQAQNRFDVIYFSFDSSTLSPASTTALTKTAEQMRKKASTRIRIEGNCDERGSDEYNLALGDRRANAAKKYLVTSGIAADRIATVSYGKEKPADPAHNEAAWAKNRRDEFVTVSP